MSENRPQGSRSEPSGWRSRDVLRVTAVIIGVYALAQLLWATRFLVFTIFLGLLFGLAVGAGADQLQRLRIPRVVGAPLVVGLFLALLGGFGTWVGPTVREQSVELRTRLPQSLDKLEHWIEDRGGGVIATVLGLEPPRELPATIDTTTGGVPRPATDIAPPGQPPGQPDAVIVEGVTPAPETEPLQPRITLRERIAQQLRGAGRYFLPVLSSTLVVVAGIVLVLFLAIYVAVNPGIYRRGAMYLVPRHMHARVEATVDAVNTTLRRWLVTQLIAMVLIGIVTTIVLLVLRVPAAIPLGMLAGLLEFIPNVGPILSAVPAIAMGFVDSPEKALAVGIAYVAIQFVENHLLIPVLMQEGLDLPPALTLSAQALMALMFGFMGLLLAVPILAVVVVTIRAWSSHEEPAG